MKKRASDLKFRISRYFFNSPARMSIAGFLVLILTGTGLLMLPAAATGRRIGFIDALFTATSAGCVTGLSVMDTGGSLTLFGQGVLLGLIQLGGLGIMTVSILFILSAGRKPGIGGRVVIQDTFTHSGTRNPAAILKDVVGFTLLCEGIGAILLFLRFYPGNNIAEALRLSLFHAVSAFCNAGFSLFSNNLMDFQGDWLVNLSISFLVIAGGIGFLVLSELKVRPPMGKRRWSRLSLHSRLVIVTTILLLLAGFLSILFMEWNNTLKGLPPADRFLGAFFLSVSARTAGFNTLPMGNMANETLFVVIVLMFIGAGPGSCAGGIKSTTFATLVLWGVSGFRGQSRPQVFKRSIPPASIEKAVSVAMVGVLVVSVGTMALLMSEIGEVPHVMSRGKFLELFFEVVSAFGTAGLSMGITETLSTVGKLTLTAIMFLGRLGPLVVAMALIRERKTRYSYAEEHIMVG